MPTSMRESEAKCSLTSIDNQSSEELLSEYVATRSERLFEQLYARHREEIHVFLTKFLNDACDADEVTQNVFLRIYQRPQSYRPGSPVRPWLFGIANHEAVDFLDIKSAKKCCSESKRTFSLTCTLPEESNDSFAAELPDHRELLPDEEVQLHEICNQVRELVASLRDCDRDVIRSVHLNGMTHRQAAKALGIPEGTVRCRNRRGLATLRGMLDCLGKCNESAA